jgi:hypothetical protein
LRSFFTVWLNKRQDKEIGLNKAFIANLIWVVVYVISLFILTYVSVLIFSIAWQTNSIIYHLISILAHLLNFSIGIFIMSLFFEQNLFENFLTVVCIIIFERIIAYIISGIVFLLAGFFLSNGINLFWGI